MAEENFTLKTFYENWKKYQDHIKDAVAPLSAEQLGLRAAPELRSVGENATHIIGCRAGWFTYTMGEDYAEVKALPNWGEQDVHLPTGQELAQALDLTWNMVADCLARWNDEDMQQMFDDDWDGEIVHLSRAWIVYHVMEHDLHHGGELSFTLGMHGVKADFPG